MENAALAINVKVLKLLLGIMLDSFELLSGLEPLQLETSMPWMSLLERDPSFPNLILWGLLMG